LDDPAASTLNAARGRRIPLSANSPNRLDFDRILDRHQYARTDKDLTGLCFVAEPRGDIGHRADGGIVEAFLKADGAERRVKARLRRLRADAYDALIDSAKPLAYPDMRLRRLRADAYDALIDSAKPLAYPDMLPIPIPKRSTSPRATSTLWGWMV
jgi:hypothetical protein